MVRRLTHCCCFTVRSGAIILASFGLFAAIFNVVAYSFLFDNEENINQLINSAEENFHNMHEQGQMDRASFITAMRVCDAVKEYLPTFLIACLTMAVICFLKNSLLLGGVLYNNRFLMLPWLISAYVFTSINLLVALSFPFIVGISACSLSSTAFTLFFVALGFYYCHCVLSHYLNLRDEAHPSHDKLPLVLEEAIPEYTK